MDWKCPRKNKPSVSFKVLSDLKIFRHICVSSGKGLVKKGERLVSAANITNLLLTDINSLHLTYHAYGGISGLCHIFVATGEFSTCLK